MFVLYLGIIPSYLGEYCRIFRCFFGWNWKYNWAEANFEEHSWTFQVPIFSQQMSNQGGGWAPIRTTQHLKSPLDMSLQVIIGWVYPPPRMAVTTKIIAMKTWWGFLLHPPWTTCFIPYHLLGPVHLGHRVLHFWYHDAGYLDVVDHVCLACFLEVCITLPENQQLALKIWWFQIGISSSRGSIFRG